MSTLRRLEDRQRKGGYEAHVPAESAPSEEDPWLPGAHEDEGRAEGSQTSPREGTQTPDRLAGRLRRSERLTTGAGFQALFYRGRRIDRPLLLVLYREMGHARRVGFAVSRQINRAVDRNRVRRRLRAAYRVARSAAPDSVDLVVIGKRRALAAEFGALVTDLRDAFVAMAPPEAAVWTPR